MIWSILPHLPHLPYLVGSVAFAVLMLRAWQRSGGSFPAVASSSKDAVLRVWNYRRMRAFLFVGACVSMFVTALLTVVAFSPWGGALGYNVASVSSSWGVTILFSIMSMVKAMMDEPASKQDVQQGFTDLRQGLAGMRQDSAEQSRQMLDAMQSITAQISRLADRLPEPDSQGHDISGGDSQSGD